MVEGIARAQQQLSLALREPINGDRFHLEWGSSLPGMIGGVQKVDTPPIVRAEVSRVVNNYILTQNDQIRNRASLGLRPNISAEEMITGISTVNITSTLDRMSVRVTIRTAGRKEFSVLTTPGTVS